MYKPSKFNFVNIISLIILINALSPLSFATTADSLAEKEHHQWFSESIDWTAIKELNLETAARIALAGNPTLDAAEARVRQALDRVHQAKADYWPRLDLTASGENVWLSDNDLETKRATTRLLDPLAAIDDSEDRYQTGIIASWKMFDGFARKFAYASARYGRDQNEAALGDSRRMILSAVAMAYFAAQLTRENVDIARADEAFNQRRLVEAQVRRKEGAGSLSDELNFEIRINEALAARIKADRNYEAAIYALAALMGIEEARLPPFIKLAPLREETKDELTSPDAAALIVYAHKHRPDIRQSEYVIQQARAQVEIARSRFYPRLNLLASYDGVHIDNMKLEKEDYGASIGLSLSYNIFSGGIDRARVREAKNRTQEMEKNLKSLKITVSAEVRKSLAQLLSAQEQLRLQRINARLVQTNRNLVDKEYTAGQASLVRLNEAQRDLVTSQSRLALTLANLHQAWFSLEANTGRILEVLGETSK